MGVSILLFNHDICFLHVSNFRRPSSLQLQRILRVVAQLREISIVYHRVVFTALDAGQTRARPIVLSGSFLLDSRQNIVSCRMRAGHSMQRGRGRARLTSAVLIQILLLIILRAILDVVLLLILFRL